MRCLERSSETFDSQPPSSWRISRLKHFIVDAVLAAKVMLRT